MGGGGLGHGPAPPGLHSQSPAEHGEEVLVQGVGLPLEGGHLGQGLEQCQQGDGARKHGRGGTDGHKTLEHRIARGEATKAS